MWKVRLAITCILIVGLMGSAFPPKPSVIVVGAGPSGIAAATRLLKDNFTHLTILEAENRIGGRINSVKFGSAYVDLGAEYCHGQEGNIVYSMVKDMDILKHSVEGVTFYQSNGEVLDKKTGEKLMNFAESLTASNETIEGCENAVSVGECLSIKTKALLATAQDAKDTSIYSGVLDWANNYLCSYDSPLDLNDLTITTQYKECGGDLHMNWNGHGYKTILDIMMQKYPNNNHQLPIDDKILLGKVVGNISNWQEGDKVTVATTDGGIYEANHVIFTASLGVLKANYERLFSPPLPRENIEAIQNFGFGAILKVILHFPERWWAEDPMWTFLWTVEDKAGLKEKNLEWLLGLDGFVQAENNPNVLISWYSGSYVPTIENLSEEQIIDGHKYVINKFLRPHYNVTVPDKLIKTTWYSNPNFRGTYSYESVKGYATGAGNFQAKLGSPLVNEEKKPTVLFAGEATHPYYFSTVHGAIESGYREADRLIELYQN